MESIKDKIKVIQKEQIEGTGTRYEKQKRAKEMVFNLFLDGEVDWLIEEGEKATRYENAFDYIEKSLQDEISSINSIGMTNFS